MESLKVFEKAYPLRFDGLAPEVVDKLKVLPRTGWVQWGIDEPETVYEHIRAVRLLAFEYKDALGLPDDELRDLLDILEVHDWPEALVGDGVILGDETNVDKIRAYKQSRELEAMQTICESLEEGAYILSLYERYMRSTDRVAQLAKQIEKLQAVLLAAEYEKQYEKEGLTQEFVHYTRDLIHDSFLQEEMEKIAHHFPIAVLLVLSPAFFL